MIRRAITSLSLLALAVSTASAQFQQGFTFVSGGSGFDSYSGKFAAGGNISMTGETGGVAFQIWCVDPMQYVGNGDTYTAWVTPLNAGTANFGHTLALVSQSPNGYGISHAAAANGSSALTDYTYAAYLASQMTSGNQNSYECAIWQVMGYAGSGWPMGGCSSSASATLIGSITAGDLATINLANWGVISDGKDKQEFIYHYSSVTPEPATMSLLATGLVALAGVGSRRRKRVA